MNPCTIADGAGIHLQIVVEQIKYRSVSENVSVQDSFYGEKPVFPPTLTPSVEWIWSTFSMGASVAVSQRIKEYQRTKW
jgi:hypothetical protein